LTDIKLTKF